MCPRIRDSLLSEHARQRAFFAEQAQCFDEGPFGGRANRNHYAKAERIAKWCGTEQNSRVLEVGVGTGIHASWLLHRLRCEYTGVDLSPEMLSVARERLGNKVELLEAAGESLPFSGASFDAVFCSGSLHHMANQAQAIQEMARVVKPLSRVIICEPNKWNPLNMWKWLTDPIERGASKMTVANLRRWFGAAGLVVDHFEYFNYTPPLPTRLSVLFDQLDVSLARAPLIRGIASMVLFVGHRAGETTVP